MLRRIGSRAMLGPWLGTRCVPLSSDTELGTDIIFGEEAGPLSEGLSPEMLRNTLAEDAAETPDVSALVAAERQPVTWIGRFCPTLLWETGRLVMGSPRHAVRLVQGTVWCSSSSAAFRL